jgi:hypothetical protein
MKAVKCTILTTDFREEADVLSDRIVITTKEPLPANGTRDVLKNQISNLISKLLFSVMSYVFN